MLVGLTKRSGEGGIRTLGSRKGYNGFRDRPNRPLWHLSEMQASIILDIHLRHYATTLYRLGERSILT